MTETTEASPRIPTFMDICSELHRNAEKLQTLNRLLNTDAKIAQTPKEVVWTLNKAKLYRYVPVVPAEQRHKTAVVSGVRHHEPATRARSPPRSQLCRVHGATKATTSICWTGEFLVPKTRTSNSTTTCWNTCLGPFANSKASREPNGSACWAGASGHSSARCMRRFVLTTACRT